jgi:flagellar biosynthesis protein FlhB
MERSILPSPERRSRALREGDSPISGLAVRVAALAALALVAPSAATAVAARFGEELRAGLAAPDGVAASSLATDVAILAGPVIAVAVGVAVLASLAQTGGVVTFRRSHADRPGPAGAIRGVLEGRRLYEAGRGALIAIGVLCVALRTLAAGAPALATGLGRPTALLGMVRRLADQAAWAAVGVLVSAAAIDVVVQRRAWVNRLRLSPADAKRERRDSEGDPALRRARRRAHEELASLASPGDASSADGLPPS